MATIWGCFILSNIVEEKLVAGDSLSNDKRAAPNMI
jgi:hypothetical protein